MISPRLRTVWELPEHKAKNNTNQIRFSKVNGRLASFFKFKLTMIDKEFYIVDPIKNIKFTKKLRSNNSCYDLLLNSFFCR